MVSLDQGGKVDKTASEKAAETAVKSDLNSCPNSADADPVSEGKMSEPEADFDDFVMTVTGKSRLVRGRAWKKCGTEEYVRYKCFDDGMEYLPGGEWAGLAAPAAGLCWEQLEAVDRMRPSARGRMWWAERGHGQCKLAIKEANRRGNWLQLWVLINGSGVIDCYTNI